MSSRRVRALGFLGGALVVGPVAAIGYEAYRTAGGLTPQVASVATTAVLVVITGWYAFSTHRLLAVTQTQTRAVRAGNLPNIDVPLWEFGVREAVNPEGFEFSVNNRGQGPARDVTFVVAVETPGRAFEYRGVVQPSLIENRRLDLNVQPHFLVREGTVAAVGHDPDEYATMTDDGQRYCVLPVIELFSLLSEQDPGQRVEIAASVEYADILGTTDEEPVVEPESVDPGETGLQLALGSRADAVRRSGRLARYARRVRGLGVEDPAPYEEVLDVQPRGVAEIEAREERPAPVRRDGNRVAS